jgi:hypothetical protein
LGGLGLDLGLSFLGLKGSGFIFSAARETSSSLGGFVMERVTLMVELPVDLNRAVVHIVTQHY